ncbi:hypothetical protein C8Q69DRAFT_477636, partial [Paecilomyces variotii]
MTRRPDIVGWLFSWSPYSILYSASGPIYASSTCNVLYNVDFVPCNHPKGTSHCHHCRYNHEEAKLICSWGRNKSPEYLYLG